MNAPLKLTLFAAGLVAAFGASYGIAAAVAPAPTVEVHEGEHP